MVKEKGVDGKIETFCFLQLTDPEGHKIQRLIRVASIDQILGVVRSHALQEEMQWEESRKLTSAKKSRNARAKRAMNEQELEWDRDPRLPSLSIKPILSVRAFTESFLNNAQQLVFMTILLTYPVLSIMLRKRFRKNNNFDDWMTAFQGSKKFKQVNVTKHVKTRFADVAGLEQPKLEIQEFVDFLKDPEKYMSIGARIPRGALLSGPPGTGKTLLAKACAGESKVPFFYCSGSEFVEMFVGVGASRVRELFQASKKAAPAIIFIDEIDSIGRKRNSFGPSRSEENSTLNQLLVEMDGFGTEENVVVFAATNRKELLDEALIRPGRFDRDIDISLPELSEREDIFKVHLKPLKLGNVGRDSLAMRLASLTPGFSGAEIMNVCNEAAILAVRASRKTVTRKDFELAVEKVIGGIEKQMDDADSETRETVAVHEAGHGVVSWFLEGAMPLLKVTIIPRSKGALGFAQYLPNEAGLQTEQELRDKITTVLGGRIAEEEFFGRVTTGAYDDLQKAKQIALSIVTVVGMTPELGPLNIKQDAFGKAVTSRASQELVDELVRKIIRECSEECRGLIRTHREKIRQLSDELLEKNTLDLQDIQRILGPRPFKYKVEYEKYLAASNEIKEEIELESQEIAEDVREEEERPEDQEEDDDDEFYFFLDDKEDVVTKIEDDPKDENKK